MISRRRRKCITLCSPKKLMVVFCIAAAIYLFKNHNNADEVQIKDYASNTAASGRKLLSTVAWEQCDFEIGHVRNYSDPESWYNSNSISYAWVALYLVLVLIVFTALAIICDDFFVPSLEAISEKLNLSEDVAGATFMAAGSSAPELFTSIAGVTVESDVGVGTIVGSAVFNLLGICALSAAFAGQTLQLDWRPLLRDSMFYGMSICLFILFAFDGQFEVWESAVMLLLYIIYIIIMSFNPHLMKLFDKCCKKKRIRPTGEGEDEIRKFSHVEKGQLHKSLTGGKVSSTKLKTIHSDTNVPKKSESASSTKPNKPSRTPSPLTGEPLPLAEVPGPSAAVEDVPEVEERDVMDWDMDYDDATQCTVLPCLPPVYVDVPSSKVGGNACLGCLRICFSWILFVISFPFIVLFTWTIPDCSTPQTKKWYPLSFLMSIAWIAALSFAMVTLVGRAGCILGIDKFTMGLVVVAIGTSIPDALSSILVARDGYGDMAVSNAIGSNVFDIDLGIGLPFLISSLIRDVTPVKLLSADDQLLLESGEMTLIPHVKFGILLLAILFISLVIFCMTKFRLNKYLGVAFIFMYILFVAYAYIQDLYCDNTC